LPWPPLAGSLKPSWQPTPRRTAHEEVEVETWDAIRARRNVRSYREEAIAPEDLDQILEAARRTPSASNQQAWDFVVCTDPEQLGELAKVRRSAGHVARSAATIALVAPNPESARSRDLIQYDLGQATMSIMVAAADLGIGSAHASVSDQELARRLLGFPEDRFCAWLLSLGVPADRPLTPIRRPNRRPFDDVIHRGHW
jgi:nitroreductase